MVLLALPKYLFKARMDALYDKKHDVKATLEAIRELEVELVSTHVGSLGLSPQDFNTDGLKDYEKNRIKGHEAFSEVKDQDGNPIGQKLAGSEAAHKLDACFEDNDKLKEAIENYSQAQEAFNQLCQQVGIKYGAQDLIGEYKKYATKARDAQSEQQKKEKEALSQLFKDPAFTDSLKEKLDGQDVEKVKDNMLAKLEEKHKEEKNKLDTTITGNESLLHQAAAKEEQTLRIRMYLANSLKYGSKLMRKQARELIEQMQAEEGKLTLATNGDISSGKNPFEGITLKSFKSLQSHQDKGFETRRGRKIYEDEGTGTFTIKIKNRWRNPMLHLDPRHSIRSEIRDIVDLVSAAGYDSIELTADFKSEEIAMERGKDCARAALEGGFPPENIKIIINGKPHELKDLLSGSELQKYQRIQKEAAQLFQSKSIPGGDKAAAEEMKNKISELRKPKEPTPSLENDDSKAAKPPSS